MAQIICYADSEEAAASTVAASLLMRNCPGVDPEPLPVEVSPDGVHWTVHLVPLPDMTEEEAAAAVTR